MLPSEVPFYAFVSVGKFLVNTDKERFLLTHRQSSVFLGCIMKRLFQIFGCLVASHALLLLTGCGQSDNEPPSEEVRAAVAKAIPASLSVVSVEYEAIHVSEGASLLKLKATLKPREDLCRSIGKVLRGASLLEVVYRKGEKIVVYGEVGARRQVDRWTLGRVSMEKDWRNFPRPVSGFPAGSVIAGTAEGDEAVKAYEAWKAEQEQARIEAKRQQQLRLQEEAARQKAAQEAELARAAQERQARLARLQTALTPGRQYLGELHYRKDIQPVRLKIISREGIAVVAELSNPVMPSARGKLTGTINPDAQSEEYAVVLAMVPDDSENPLGWHLYGDHKGILSLNLTDAGGFEGEAVCESAGREYRYKIRLQALGN
ncbi:hypothetical protein [Ruficoccus sp. ZRK36]|uniref:hypothetical protein n=1 Tax=Ruficoccus sp. ZRK36 TaxID=2866311 RepID=UPI001C738317|nr:hypothetical protein [Ruficoccus sp. ZRK36]QYY34801.1 hypothetical protein K0V07_10870 [Ruficoccus sp. ZRK36]QYY37295.1 hypothetical protein K0V07_07370 [Ruficoccus sp. ZRK36]